MSLSQDTVLLVTHSGDYFTVDRVEEALSKKGVKTFRFNTDQFPLKVKLDAQFDVATNRHRLDDGVQSIATAQVQAVWMRRIWEPDLGQDLDPQYRRACTREVKATLEGVWDSLRSARWVDDLTRVQVASNKHRQLRVASEVGLTIPRTLITNNAEAACSFFQQVDGKMVSKLQTALAHSMEAPSTFMYTSVVKPEDLEDAESLRYCPMVFQEQVHKEQELRVVYVNGQVFVGALNAVVYDKNTVDWRRPGVEVGAWSLHQMPDDLVSQLRMFMDRFGLFFGALDFILTPSGEYVFLEVNPAGEWGMIERDLDLPISQAIADTLIA